jgi:hypothetical protein
MGGGRRDIGLSFVDHLGARSRDEGINFQLRQIDERF